MLNPYDVFAAKKNGTYLWIGDAASMDGLWKLIETRKPEPEDKFMIYNRTTGNVSEVTAGQFRLAS